MSLANPKISVDQRQLTIEKLTPFGFTAILPLPIGALKEGQLELGDHSIQVKFRVRDQIDEIAACSFSDLSQTHQNDIRTYLANLGREPARNASSRTVHQNGHARVASSVEDEVGTATVQESRPERQPVPEAAPATVRSRSRTVSSSQPTGENTQRAKSRSRIPIALLTIAALLAAGFYFVRHYSQVEVDNPSLVGNSLTMPSRVEGEIVEVNFAQGDQVREGDVLMRLKNQTMQSALKIAKLQLLTAEFKFDAAAKRLVRHESKLKIASEKLALDLEVATAQLETMDKSRQVTIATVERLKPFVKSGSVTPAEFDTADSERLKAEADFVAAESKIKQIQFAKKMADKGILVLGDRIEDDLANLTSEIEVAKAELKEKQIAKAICERQVDGLEVVAPCDGILFSHRKVGEYLKVADQAFALKGEGKIWAAGQVSTTQANRVRPGQSVAVTISSTGERLEGVVVAVGQEAVVGRSEFVGSSNSNVPVKVMIDDLPDNLASGVRVAMAINTGLGIDWLDKTMGYEVKPVDSVAPPASEPMTPVTEDVEPPVGSDIENDIDKNVDEIVERMVADQ